MRAMRTAGRGRVGGCCLLLVAACGDDGDGGPDPARDQDGMVVTTEVDASPRDAARQEDASAPDDASPLDAASDGAHADASIDGGSAQPPDTGVVQAADAEGPPAVRYMGRVDTTDPKGAAFSWSGTGVVARFTGTSLVVKMSGGQEFTPVLDGVVRPKLTPTAGGSMIASGLASGAHTIELYRRTEANQGISQFLGFTFGAGGTLLSPPPPPARKIELIGDSISCGYGNEGANANCTFTPQTENHYLTYGAIAARNLGAELSTIAWSGRGVVCNYGDGPDSCVEPLPDVYERALGTEEDRPWDFSQFRPNVVVINLGTNDVSTDDDPSAAEFTSAYKVLLMRVRAHYPQARILCSIGPLLGDDDLRNVRRYIANAIADSGDQNAGTFDFDQQRAEDGLGCDYHPSLKTHQRMADRLTAVLKQELGW